MKFLNELAASNDRNFKFTALGSRHLFPRLTMLLPLRAVYFTVDWTSGKPLMVFPVCVPCGSA